MAVNGSSHNAPGIATGPATEPPPPMLTETKEAVLDAAAEDGTGQSLPGKDTIGEQPPSEHPKDPLDDPPSEDSEDHLDEPPSETPEVPLEEPTSEDPEKSIDESASDDAESLLDECGRTADGEVHVRFKGGGMCGILKHLQAMKKAEA